MMKKVKASKSASDTSLRAAATGAASKRSAFPTLRKRNTWAPSKKKGNKPVSTKPKKVKSTREKKEVDPNIEDAVIVSNERVDVKSERKNSGAISSGSKPKAIAGPPKPKKNSGPKVKKDKTRTVFVAEPKVTLDDGPDFGKITHEITKTKQPVNPRQFR
jgi:hypothetical protein